jgi:hypothetical protein
MSCILDEPVSQDVGQAMGQERRLDLMALCFGNSEHRDRPARQEDAARLCLLTVMEGALAPLVSGRQGKLARFIQMLVGISSNEMTCQCHVLGNAIQSALLYPRDSSPDDYAWRETALGKHVRRAKVIDVSWTSPTIRRKNRVGY